MRPDLATRVSCHQEKAMMLHDKHTEFLKIVVGDIILECDHLSR